MEGTRYVLVTFIDAGIYIWLELYCSLSQNFGMYNIVKPIWCIVTIKTLHLISLLNFSFSMSIYLFDMLTLLVRFSSKVLS